LPVNFLEYDVEYWMTMRKEIAVNESLHVAKKTRSIKREGLEDTGA
jgi:hypothetical protein